ncbi:MAG: hemerythrin domain-containing protein, partial [Ferruginibacter sp.]
AEIVHELQEQNAGEKELHMPFVDMNAEQLITYIIIHHHFFVKLSMPLMLNHLEKVAGKHGNHFPYMQQVLKLFVEINEDMTAHMQKEETVLFPRIKGLEVLYKSSQVSDIADAYILAPIDVLEAEHDRGGEILYQIRQLTNNYSVPVEACTTFKLSLSELRNFEEDLHKHVHLENNLLFPLAAKMLEELKRL